MLPFFIASYHYDYTTAASLVTATNLAGSLIQPLIGRLSDKKELPYIIPLGLLLAGGGMSLTGFVTNYYIILFFMIISGIGAALFHPSAAKIVNHASNVTNRAKSLSIFSFGGSTGFAVGPILVAVFVGNFGLKGMLVFIAKSNRPSLRRNAWP
ncbi:MFS transporter [Campylobacter concisus]|uniref:MFS transporter n=1 Tax=Campylobacter concisus TaxID=199 RepID=UPI001CB6B8C0|nr:MFS transporter [Campylobacter concisus]